MSSHSVQHAGRSFPLGATLDRAGTNFSVFAKQQPGGSVVAVRRRGCPGAFAGDRSRPARQPDLSLLAHLRSRRCGRTIYAYRISGPFDPERGLRFDPSKVLLDPYGKCIARPAARTGDAARRPGDNARPRSRASWSIPPAMTGRGTPRPAALRQDRPLRMHVGGFTRHPNSASLRTSGEPSRG